MRLRSGESRRGEGLVNNVYRLKETEELNDNYKNTVLEFLTRINSAQKPNVNGVRDVMDG